MEVSDNEILNILKPDKNEILTRLSESDLIDLLSYINRYYLPLRERLGFDDTVTFGLEIESEYAFVDRIKARIKDKYDDSWIVKPDLTLVKGVEINTPRLIDTDTAWIRIEKVCDIMKTDSRIGNCAGGHIHIGAQTLGSDKQAWLNFIKLWSVYENVIFRFLYGEYLNCRPTLSEYAKPLANYFGDIYGSLIRVPRLTTDYIRYIIGNEKKNAVNFKNITEYDKIRQKNTLEFRCPNGTLEPVIWQNNVNLIVKILQYVNSEKFDLDTIIKREKDTKGMTLEQYGNIYLEQAIEFCDLIFDNNLDKIYFLRQYLKTFEVSSEYEKASPFVMKR